MIKVFSGTDTYESEMAARNYLSNFAPNYISVDADDLTNINQLLQHLEGIDMFSDSSTVFAKRFFDNKKLVTYLTDNFDYLNKFDIVIWQDGNIDGKLKVSKLLKSKSDVEVFEMPKEGEFRNWVNKKIKELKINLKSNQIDFFVERIGINKWQTINEFEKIRKYLEAHNKSDINTDELNLLLGFDIRGDLWKFLDYVGLREKEHAISEFEKLMYYEDSSQLIISMLNREFTLISQLLYSDEKNLRREDLGINPYVLRKVAQKAGRYKLKELKNLMYKLLKLDFAIKRGDLGEKLGLTLLLTAL